MKVDVYPTADEIVNGNNISTCQECGRTFSNSSACRFHQIKKHAIVKKGVVSDKRILDRMDGEATTYIYHCPESNCMKKNVRFDGFRNLKQHYIRVHTEKKYSCKCGYRTALEKDITYHKKVRCVLVKGKKENAKCSTSEGISGGINNASNSSNDNNITQQIVIMIVPTENVTETLNNLPRILTESHLNRTMKTVSSGCSTSEIPEMNEEDDIEETNNPINNSIGNNMMFMQPAQSQTDIVGIDNNEFFYPMDASQSLEYCDRGTGTEMGDMMGGSSTFFEPTYSQNYPVTTSDASETADFEYDKRRTMGTSMSTRHMGSMIEEDFLSTYLRDIETQTPSMNGRQNDPLWTWNDN